MNCPTELSLSMFADGALEAHDAAEIDAHVLGCDACRARIAALRDEANMLRNSLAVDPTSVAVPQFARPATLGAIVAAVVAMLGVAALSSTARALLGAAVPDAVKWFNPLDAGGVVNLFVRAGIFLLSDRG